MIRRRFRNSSINAKLQVIILSSCTVVLFVSSALFMTNEAVLFREGAKRDLTALADLVANNISAAVLFNDRKAVESGLNELRADEHVIAAYAVTPKDDLIAQYLRDPQGDQPDLSGEIAPEKVRQLVAELRRPNSLLNDYLDLDLETVRPITVDHETIGSIILCTDTSQLLDKLVSFAALVAAIWMAALAAALIVGLRLQKLIANPILELAGMMTTMSREKDYTVRAPRNSDDEIGTLVDGFNSMVSQIERQNEEVLSGKRHLQRLAHYDGLTGLPNRLLLTERLKQAVLEAQRGNMKVGVLFIDLDHFKDVNDSLGHRFGDLLLTEVALRLLPVVRPADTVARLGGDEFIILMKGLQHSADAVTVARKVLDSTAAPFFIEEKQIFISASIGITIFPDDANTADGLIKNADTAMYQAKDSGKNIFQFYSEEMQVRANRRLEIQNLLHKALEREEFVVHYQPIIDVATGRVRGLEALLRWISREKGFVSPGEFIELAEKTGVIVPIGEWVIRRVCEDIAGLCAVGVAVPVAVNISPHQFKRQDFPNVLKSIIAEYHLSPDLIHIELTETAVMENADKVSEILSDLKNLGISVSIDDFGTGYSSLSYLKKFPIDILKIDRSFVMHIPAKEDDTAIITTIMAMARTLKLRVVAEGVETAEQLGFLRALGCDHYQGFYFSPAVPIDVAREILSSHRQTAIPA